jgi:prepilin-type N-terminal cleavage/methylation domain-containing protein
MYTIHKKNTKKGFTLVEMLVSVGIFTIVMTIALGALLVVYDTYRKTRTLKNAMENVNIATESIIKRIRTGDRFSCLSFANPDICVHLAFRGRDNLQYEYKWDTNTRELLSRSCPLPLSSNLPCPMAVPLQPITSPDVLINNVKFYMYGLDNDSIQDSITVTISGLANMPGKPKYDSSFRIQTTISKRLLDGF